MSEKTSSNWLKNFIINTSVKLSCYGNEKRNISYRLVSLLCIILIILLFTIKSQTDNTNEHFKKQYYHQRRNLLNLNQVPKNERPLIRNTKLVKPFNFKVINEPINNFKSCKDTYLLIIVHSAPSHVNRRNSIRETWASENSLLPYKTSVIFALGIQNNYDNEVKREINAHGDILRGDFIDTYSNLTLKSTLLLKYASSACKGRKWQPEFIMKTDDDIFINIPLLVTSLKHDYPSKHKVITGCIKQRGSLKAINVHGYTPPQAWPEFVAGAGYIFSGNIASELYLAARRVNKPAKLEDVFVTAQCAIIAGFHPPIHDKRFSCGGSVLDDCKLITMFTGHHINPQRQVAIWEKFSSDPNPCMDF